MENWGDLPPNNELEVMQSIETLDLYFMDVPNRTKTGKRISKRAISEFTKEIAGYESGANIGPTSTGFWKDPTTHKLVKDRNYTIKFLALSEEDAVKIGSAAKNRFDQAAIFLYHISGNVILVQDHGAQREPAPLELSEPSNQYNEGIAEFE